MYSYVPQGPFVPKRQRQPTEEVALPKQDNKNPADLRFIPAKAREVFTNLPLRPSERRLLGPI
jgi:hypothetical protein